MPAISEILLIAYSGATKEVMDRANILLPKNPTYRPNLLVCPGIGAKKKIDGRGRVINPYEKPSALMSFLVPMFCGKANLWL